MKKNNARSLKIPSASWIRNAIKEEVKAQLEEREAQRRSPRHDDFWDGPRTEERMERPMDERDQWNEWWDGPRPRRSEREEREERPEPRRGRRLEEGEGPEARERRAWNFWDGDLMSDPIMEAPRKKARSQDWESSVDREIEASISPVDQPRRRRASQSSKGKRR